MTLQQIIYALTIEECGSMNKASEKLFIVQPTLTSAIRELENETGIKIFHRGHKGVVVTPEGREFLNDLRVFYQHYQMIMEKYESDGNFKRKFGVSTQHYSFAVKAFVEMAKQYDMNQFDFAIRETRTSEVIKDVATLKSEIGVLYMSSLNEKVLKKLLAENELEFFPLVKCPAYVYLWEGHPLAGQETIGMDQLKDYPCLSFEQDEEEFYFAEEILSSKEYPRMIRANDRATMLNLMVGLNGYTLCSGIICEELNGSDYVAVPFKADEDAVGSRMEIGYIVKKNMILSQLGEAYIRELRRYLGEL